ncbi:unnamed protein product [Schistosoma margrebowiei]|uniref:DNA mitochondrial polymerase exonuclease domain-containing protein n=1 Tax=Schistosoma margrebowiei TaxID=48269 RepID=A0A183MTU8_9TREM|nr:unnamed protein product [Schistosoma margrebowiei]
MYSRLATYWRNQGIFSQHRLCFYSSNHPKQPPTYNEVNILMIDRNLQKVLFDCQKYDYQKASFEILQEFCRLGIDITSNRHYKNPLYFSIPDLSGSNVKEHLDSVAKELSHPYMKLLESFGSPPELPKIWESSSGWTKYSWTSKRLSVYDDNCSNDINAFNSLIPIYGSKNKDISKCVIGHFVSYDRARILEEYLLDDLDWLSETSLNSLPDIYRLYCKKEPPQDKQLRSIFESGTIEDVRTNFQGVPVIWRKDNENRRNRF